MASDTQHPSSDAVQKAADEALDALDKAVGLFTTVARQSMLTLREAALAERCIPHPDTERVEEARRVLGGALGRARHEVRDGADFFASLDDPPTINNWASAYGRLCGGVEVALRILSRHPASEWYVPNGRAK